MMLVGIKRQREDWLEHTPRNSNSVDIKKSWVKLWHVQVPAKFRMFIWRLAKMSLPTKEVRAHRQMATKNTCMIFHSATDSWRHALLDCNMSRAVWALANEELMEHLIMNRTEDARLLIFWLFDTLKQNELAIVLFTMWAIWWAIRTAIHDEEFQDPMSTWAS